jgi:iron-sulfur cluster repair protein YtfE (RIC family)
VKRRSLIAGTAATLVAKTAGGARPTIFERFHDGLVQVHSELRAAAAGIARSIPDEQRDAATRAAILGFAEELLNHHKSEDSFFFPGFRAAGRMRSSDVAWLAKKDEEHVEIHRLCIELRDATQQRARDALAVRTWRSLVVDHVRQLAKLSAPHFAEEEATLSAAHVATLLTEGELIAIYRDMGQNWHRRR